MRYSVFMRFGKTNHYSFGRDFSGEKSALQLHSTDDSPAQLITYSSPIRSLQKGNP